MKIGVLIAFLALGVAVVQGKPGKCKGTCIMDDFNCTGKEHDKGCGDGMKCCIDKPTKPGKCKGTCIMADFNCTGKEHDKGCGDGMKCCMEGKPPKPGKCKGTCIMADFNCTGK